MRHRVAIVGTAGRSASEQQRLTREHFEQMCRAVENLLRVWKLSWHEVTLVSGGSAWSDNVVVQLFLRHEHDTQLELFFAMSVFRHNAPLCRKLGGLGTEQVPHPVFPEAGPQHV